MTQMSPALRVSMGYIYSVLPTCGVIISIYSILNIVDLLKKIKVCKPSLRQLLRPLSSVERAGLSASLDSGSIQSAPEDVVTYTRKVLHTASPYKHDGVLLEVVPFARDVGIDLLGVGKTYTGNLTHC